MKIFKKRNVVDRTVCGMCKRPYSGVVQKWKPLKGEWITQKMDRALLHFGGLCQECMDKIFIPITTEGATQTDLEGEQF